MLTEDRNIAEQVQKALFELRDIKYKEFHSKLIPNIEPDRVIGVRTPQLRKLARELAGGDTAKHFIKLLPHEYYEENNLHGAIISLFKEYDRAVVAVNDFLPYVDNWATCDMLSPKVFKKHTSELIGRIEEWLGSEHEYTVRFGIKMLMELYLDEKFDTTYSDMVAAVRRDEYYIKMMAAWYFATALAKQYDCAVKYIEQRRLDAWTHNKSIQKAIESYRVTDEHKKYLRTLKV